MLNHIDTMLGLLHDPWMDQNMINQTGLVKKLIPEIRKLNTKTSDTYIPIMNTGINENAYRVDILGFDGVRHRTARVLLDTGCVCDAVIGRNVAKGSGLVESKLGVSFVYVVTIGSYQFIGYGIAENNGKSSTSYIKDSPKRAGVVSTCNKQDTNLHIDLLIGYRTLAEMANHGIYATVVSVVPETFVSIPFSDWAGLECKFMGNKIKVHIDTGVFDDCDIMVSSDFISRNRKYLGTSSQGYIDSMIFVYGDFSIKMENLRYSVMHRPFIRGNTNIDCVPGKHFIETRLIPNGIFPKIY